MQRTIHSTGPEMLLFSATNISRSRHMNEIGSIMDMCGAPTLIGASDVGAFLPNRRSQTKPRLHRTPRKHHETGCLSNKRNLLSGLFARSLRLSPAVAMREKNIASNKNTLKRTKRIGSKVTAVIDILNL